VLEIKELVPSEKEALFKCGIRWDGMNDVRYLHNLCGSTE
jgi:hypothetical protein